MAYSLNTSLSTQKITVCSTGLHSGPIYKPTFNLTRPIQLDDRLLHIVGVEMITLKHPTFYHSSYMTGEYTTIDHITDTQTSRVITSANFPPFLNGLYVSPSNTEPYVLDSILYSLIYLLKNLIEDDSDEVQFSFAGFDDNVFPYNNMGYRPGNNLVMDPTDQFVVSGSLQPVASVLQTLPNYVSLLNSLYMDRDCRFTIKTNRQDFSFFMNGNWCQMYGLDPTIDNILSTTVPPLKAQLRLSGHNYIIVQCNIGSQSLSATCGSKLETTNLLCTVPTPNYPAYIETYIPGSAGSKTGVSTNIIDTIDLEFVDEYGNDVLSLESYVLTLVVDQVKTEELPGSSHVSLFNVRKKQMEDTRSQLRNYII